MAPLIALIVGAGAATGAYALIDDGGSNASASSTKYVVLDQNAFPGKDEAATGAAIAKPQGRAVELRGSKASATGSTSSSTSDSSSTATPFSGHR